MKQLMTILLLSSLALSSCKKEPVSNTATLEIFIGDMATQAPISDVSITLYANGNDFENQTNPIGTAQLTDANGIVRFSNLSTTTTYYYSATKGCKTNRNNVYQVNSFLTANQTTTVNSYIFPAFTLSYVNNSPNPYQMVLNGFSLGALPAGSTYILHDINAATSTVEALQISGYTTTPNYITQTYNPSCGASIEFIIP